MNDEHEKNKHLTYDERNYIEIGLNKGKNFTEIANDLNKDRRTISREIQKHRFKKIPSKFNNSGNLCIKRKECKKTDCTTNLKCYQEEICYKLTGIPYVCNGCDSKAKCRKIKYYYYSKFSNDEYYETLSSCRKGINLSKSEAYEIDKLLSPLVKEKNQSINHIYINHPDELPFSKPTMYTYINLGVFSFRNIDLPRKVRYHKRKDTKNQRVRRETAIRKNRTYEDFKEFISKNPDCSIVEMDTVEGIKGGKVFLTIFFRKARLMLIYIMDNKSMECVEKVFIGIKKILGGDMYSKLINVILTDNGSEFFNPMSIEKFEENGEIISNVFYCDASASWQKGGIEKNHEYIRYVLPKGTSFNELTQHDADILMSNINSTNRDSLNGKTPYEAMTLMIDESIMNLLGVEKIMANDVNLSPNLLKRGDK